MSSSTHQKRNKSPPARFRAAVGAATAEPLVTRTDAASRTLTLSRRRLAQLWPHQGSVADAWSSSSESKRMLLDDEPGSGKTTTALLGALQALRADDSDSCEILIIVPSEGGTYDAQWRADMAELHGVVNDDVRSAAPFYRIVTVGRMGRALRDGRWQPRGRPIVLVDEAHDLADRVVRRHERIRQAQDDADRLAADLVALVRQGERVRRDLADRQAQLDRAKTSLRQSQIRKEDLEVAEAVAVSAAPAASSSGGVVARRSPGDAVIRREAIDVRRLRRERDQLAAMAETLDRRRAALDERRAAIRRMATDGSGAGLDDAQAVYEYVAWGRVPPNQPSVPTPSHVLLMTATPMVQSPVDVAPLLHIVWSDGTPRLQRELEGRFPLDESAFIQRFLRPNPDGSSVMDVDAYEAAWRRGLVASFRIADTSAFPRIERQRMDVVPPPPPSSSDDDDDDGGVSRQAADLILRLVQPVLHPPADADIEQMRRDPLSDTDLDTYIQLDRGIVVVADSTDVLGRVVEAMLGRQPTEERRQRLVSKFGPVLELQTPPDKRADLVASYNQGDFSILFMTREAGGLGLSLRGTAHLVVVTPVLVEAERRQLEGRVARLDSHPVAPWKRGSTYGVGDLVKDGSDVGSDGKTYRATAPIVAGGGAALVAPSESMYWTTDRPTVHVTYLVPDRERAAWDASIRLEHRFDVFRQAHVAASVPRDVWRTRRALELVTTGESSLTSDLYARCSAMYPLASAAQVRRVAEARPLADRIADLRQDVVRRLAAPLEVGDGRGWTVEPLERWQALATLVGTLERTLAETRDVEAAARGQAERAEQRAARDLREQRATDAARQLAERAEARRRRDAAAIEDARVGTTSAVEEEAPSLSTSSSTVVHRPMVVKRKRPDVSPPEQ